MQQLLSLLFLGAAVAAAQSESPITRDGAYWVRTIQGPIDTSSSDRLRVETTGNVTLIGAAGQQGSYMLRVRVRAGDAREAEALLDRVNVKTGTEGGWAYLRVAPPRLVSSGVELTVTGPRALRQVWAETRGGNVQASDWDGDFEARSAGGRIAVDHIRGRSELRTAGGDIEVGAVSGPVRCSSGGGVIRVQNAGAEAMLETAGGEIFVHQADGPVQASTGGGNIRIEHAGSTVVARTAGGLIQVQQADGPVTAESSGGAIQVNSTNGVRCESAGGAIRLRNVGGAVHAFANSGSILAELGSGRDGSGKALEDSVLSTNAGDITVFIPSNLRLTVQAINETGGGSGRINSDFPDIHLRTVGFPGAGPLVAEGTLNGGGPMLRVNVVGGTIYLRRAK
jgi:hypothetical protein